MEEQGRRREPVKTVMKIDGRVITPTEVSTQGRDPSAPTGQSNPEFKFHFAEALPSGLGRRSGKLRRIHFTFANGRTMDFSAEVVRVSRKYVWATIRMVGQRTIGPKNSEAIVQ